MPNIATPAAGGAVVAAAQVLKRLNVILTAENFGGRQAITDISGAPKIYVNLFQYPEYDSGLVVHPSRPWISWRVVGKLAINIDPPDDPLLINDNWVPLTEPRLLLTGLPSAFMLPGGGLSAVAIEFDTSAQADAGDQGADRVLVSISASE